MLIGIFICILTLVFTVFYYNKLKQLKKLNNEKFEELKKENKRLEEKKIEIEKYMNDVYEKINIDKENFLEYKSHEEEKLKKEEEILKKEYILKKEILEQEFNDKEKKLIVELENISKVSQEEAFELLKEEIKKFKKNEFEIELIKYKKKLNDEKLEIAQNILTETMENIASDYTVETTSKFFKIPNDDIKGNIIGKEGRNIKKFNSLLGVDVIVDETPGQIEINTFHPIRRAVAQKALEQLVSKGVINQTRIEEEIENAYASINQIIQEKGQDIIAEYKLTNVSDTILERLGYLYFRTSYGQNVYAHTKEVADIAKKIANELNLDEELAVRCAIFHDIGKADIDSLGLSHVVLGANLARENNEQKEVINAILSHHGDVEPDNIYSIITIIADKISASRKGARNGQNEVVYKQNLILEETIEELIGVNKAFVIQGGKEMRVIVMPEIIDDDALHILGEKVKEKINEINELPWDIKVNVIRETSIKTIAKKNIE